MRCHRLLFATLVLAACSPERALEPARADDPLAVRLEGADQGGSGITVTLTGAEEATPVNTPGIGTFRMTLNKGKAMLCYELTVRDLLAPVTGAHIHRAPRGEAGGIVVPLIAPTSGASAECKAIERSLLDELRKNPEAYYVNVHTTAHPPGEIRAQLR